MEWLSHYLPEQYAAFLGLSLLLALTPGPDILYVLSRSLASGVRVGLVAASGFALGNIVHTLVVASGLGALLVANPALLAIVRYVGVLYLIYIAMIMIRKAAPIDTSVDTNKSSAIVFRQSVIANLLNPKVILFFLSLFPQFVSSAELAFGQTLLLGLSFIMVTMLSFGAVALLAGQLHEAIATRPERQILLQQIGGAALLFVAVWLAWP